MKPYLSFVTEMFDNPYPVSMTQMIGHGIGMIGVNFEAKVKGGHLQIEIANMGNMIQNKWQVDFLVGGSYHFTKEGEPSRVLATVMTAIEDFIKLHVKIFDEKPAEFLFVGKSDEPSRVAVYKLMVQKFGKKFGYKVGATSSSDGYSKISVKREDLP